MIAREIWHRSSNDLHTSRYVPRKGTPKKRRVRPARREKTIAQPRERKRKNREINREIDYEIERKR